MHDFKRSLKTGQAGEAMLNKLWPELAPIDGRKGDFMLGDKKVEVKTDSYDMNKTANFFMERYRNDNTMAPGGAHQALEHGCELFVYWFPVNGVAFIFNTAALVEKLNSEKYAVASVPNKGYNTIGFKVPRESLKELYTVKEFK